MIPSSFYWIDYETFGANPRVDRPCQFAGLRTDSDLNVIDDPLVIYSKQSDDYLPHPKACLITGITPQHANIKGICEASFIKSIRAEMQRPGTCVVGYNNIRFDDEITRHCLYRNLLDPYEHEWKNNNSRWDLIDVMRLMCALRPEGLEWPTNDDGNPIFRLEALTQVNAIEHGKAHDAMADVEATLALAKRVKAAQPKLFNYCVDHRTKSSIFPLLNVTDIVPVLHVSSRYPANRHCIAMIAPLTRHPVNKNGIIVYDLAINPEPLLELDVQEIAERLFTPRADLQESMERIALKTVHVNKCPIVVPATVLREQDAERLNINKERCHKHLLILKQHQHLIQSKLRTVFQDNQLPLANDPDFMLYNGGFLSDFDKQLLRQLHTIPVSELVGYTPEFNDARLAEMVFRYRARNYPSTLTKDECSRWNQFREKRLLNPIDDMGLSLASFRTIINDLRRSNSDSKLTSDLLDDLETYARNLETNIE